MIKMSGKLRDYQVLDVLCGGTFYKVRHKVTSNIFAWKAYNCSTYSSKQIQNIASEVKTISKVQSESLLRYYDTILHAPSKTLYFVLEYNSWQSLEQLIAVGYDSDKYIAEVFIWYLIHELAQVCKSVEILNLKELQKCITPSSIFVGESCKLRINCFELNCDTSADFMRQVGDVVRILCYSTSTEHFKIRKFHYSDDLRDVVGFLCDHKNSYLKPDVVLYHPTVLANLESLIGPKNLSEILLSEEESFSITRNNKCDSEKAVELCRGVEPLPRSSIALGDSPVYCNITPKQRYEERVLEVKSERGSLSPTLKALALELPGYVPRSRKPISQALECYKAKQISEETLSHQWMSRLVALRHREESLNQRERELIAKEILHSPAVKVVPPNESVDTYNKEISNGITLPPVITQTEERSQWERRRHRRSSSVRAKGRRKTFAYEDLDSSLSADPGDSSMIITATKITKDNMPRRSIFPEVSTKKVHFTSSNPFAESDESVTLTFYELENVDGEGYQVPRRDENVLKDITKFKYLDLEKLTSEKRSAMHQYTQSSPSKQPKMSSKVFSDITNSIKKTPSKSSLNSKSSGSSRYSMMSLKSQWSSEADNKSDGMSNRTRSSVRQSLAPTQTPIVPPEVKKSKRKSLLPFKTPFKFMTATKI